jgi:signal transduction histidine kinase
MFKVKDEKEFISKAPWEYSPRYQSDGQSSSLKAKNRIMKAIKEGNNFFEWTHKRANGEEFPATVLLTRVKEEKKIYLQGTVRDITKIKKAEEKAKESEIMKTEFLSAISHELRTPITPIKAQLQRILSTELTKQEQKDSIEIALRNTTRMDRLIQDLLEISRMKSGKFNIFKKKENINEIISNGIIDLNSFAKEKNTIITFEKGKIPEINVDKDRILEVIINLIDNAIKYGKGKILVKTKKENKNILVEIQDNGIGIPKEETKKIFSPFYRGKRLEEQKYEGTGLGLSICKGIVEAHNGKIWFESNNQKGTSFFIRLPI